MYIKLSTPDIKNALEALLDLEEPTPSELRTIEKLQAIRFLQDQKKPQEKENQNATR